MSYSSGPAPALAPASIGRRSGIWMRRLAFSVQNLSFDRICILLPEFNGDQCQSLCIHDFVVATEAHESSVDGSLLLFRAMHQTEKLRGQAPHASLRARLAREAAIEATEALPAEGRHQCGSRSSRHDDGTRSNRRERQSCGQGRDQSTPSMMAIADDCRDDTHTCPRATEERHAELRPQARQAIQRAQRRRRGETSRLQCAPAALRRDERAPGDEKHRAGQEDGGASQRHTGKISESETSEGRSQGN